MFSDETFEKLWNEWYELELKNYELSDSLKGTKRRYLKKGYHHLDSRIWFPTEFSKIKKLLLNELREYIPKQKRYDPHSFLPFLKIIIKTPRFKIQEDGEYGLQTKERPISYASHLDALIYGFYSYYLSKRYEDYIKANGFGSCIKAYRTDLNGECNIQFAKEAFDEINTRQECAVLALDIKGYFDTIDHKLLKEMWSLIIGGALPEDQFRVYKSLTNYRYINRATFLKKYNIKLNRLGTASFGSFLEFVPGDSMKIKLAELNQNSLIVNNKSTNLKTGRKIGIPQGSPMSSVLSNIYLTQFDQKVYNKSKKIGFFYQRYCDDILIVCKPDQMKSISEFVSGLLQNECYLCIQEKKKELLLIKKDRDGKLKSYNYQKLLKDGVSLKSVDIDKKYKKSVQYLGFEFDGHNIRIRSSSLSKYFIKMNRRIIRTVLSTYKKNPASVKIWKSQILARYSHLGDQNFISYAYKASLKSYRSNGGKMMMGMDSDAIRRQLSRHINQIIDKLYKSNRQVYTHFKKTDKNTIYKDI